MEQAEILSPCPKCGGTNIKLHKSEADDWGRWGTEYFYQCSCGKSSPARSTIILATQKWNNIRAEEAKQRKKYLDRQAKRDMRLNNENN